jgi:hypothetical protein
MQPDSPVSQPPGPWAYLSRLRDNGQQVAQVHPITAGEWPIGRNPDYCRVVVPDRFGAAGRIHAVLDCDNTGRCWVESRHQNGTYLNDQALPHQERVPLSDGDVISLAGPRDSRPTRCVYKLTHRPLKLPRITETDYVSENATVLVLMSNPAGTGPLQLDEELRAIDQSILVARHRDQIDLRQSVALRISDLSKAVIRYTPAIVHFSGHGSTASEIILCDDAGNPVPVPVKALGDFFRIMSPPVRCVVLNACFTREQGRAIAEHADCVIGMSRAISDAAAIIFSEIFYHALASGFPVGKAFELGRNEIALRFPRGSEHEIPVLLCRDGAENLCFTSLSAQGAMASRDGPRARSIRTRRGTSRRKGDCPAG